MPQTPGQTLGSVAWTGKYLVFWGGIDEAAGVWGDTGAAYDPSSGTWAPLPEYPNAGGFAANGAATWTGSVMITRTGGKSGCWDPTSVATSQGRRHVVLLRARVRERRLQRRRPDDGCVRHLRRLDDLRRPVVSAWVDDEMALHVDIVPVVRSGSSSPTDSRLW
jgi:hypothetical protein